ncbi:hypothetical protein ACVOMV_01875 [Mesorhizobium atlanticum]
MFGSSSGELTPVGFRQFVPGHEGARLQTFAYYTSGSAIGADIAALLDLIVVGRLETRVAMTVPWTDIGQALTRSDSAASAARPFSRWLEVSRLERFTVSWKRRTALTLCFYEILDGKPLTLFLELL